MQIMKRACSQEQMTLRKKEIVEAVSKMYDELDYQDITMKTISERISIARSSLYFYYQTKEEIMLDVLKTDYVLFIDEMTKTIETKENLSSRLTHIFLSNLRLLEIISIHLSDIETHVSLEKLIAFKGGIKPHLDRLEESVEQSFPNAPGSKKGIFFHSLLMLTHSLYPMIKPNTKQVQAMESVGMSSVSSTEDFTKNYMDFILTALK